eukprot:2389180-Amphidinium_carterae.1
MQHRRCKRRKWSACEGSPPAHSADRSEAIRHVHAWRLILDTPFRPSLRHSQAIPRFQKILQRFFDSNTTVATDTITIAISPTPPLYSANND